MQFWPSEGRQTVEGAAAISDPTAAAALASYLPLKSTTGKNTNFKYVFPFISDNTITITVSTMSLPQSPPAFSRSLKAFRKRLSSLDIEAFESTTFEDLRKAVDDIQKEQAQRRGYRNLNKIKPFLLVLQQYARVIEQFVSAKPDFLAFI